MRVTVSPADADAITLALLADRAPDATICPSEVARLLAAAVGAPSAESAWRDNMPAVHAAVDRLQADGRIRLSWKGQVLPSRAGPYWIRRATAD